MKTPSKEFIEEFKKTPGAISVCESIAIFNVAQEAPEGVYLELGSHKGKSGMSAAQGLKDGVFHLVDPIFEDQNLSLEVCERVKSVGPVSVVMIADYSTNVIPKHNDLAYVFVDSIEPEVQIGDRIYFEYTCVNKGSLLEHEGKMYCNINYASILCVVRNEEIIPIGGNVICEEYWGKDAEFTEVGGHKVFGQVSQSGLVTSIIKKPSQKEAVVKIVGKPLKGDEMELQPGDLITFPHKFGMPNNIEGKDYLFVKYWDVHAVINNLNI